MNDSTVPTNDEYFKLAKTIDQLGPLPDSLEYRDDFSGDVIKIEDFPLLLTTPLKSGGTRRTTKFSMHRPYVAIILKHVFADMLARNKPATVSRIFRSLQVRPADTESLIVAAATLEIAQFKTFWTTHIAGQKITDIVLALKQVLFAFSRLGVGHWSLDAIPYLKRIPVLTGDKYGVVRTGSCFLAPKDQAEIRQYLKVFSEDLKSDPTQFSDYDVENAALLGLSFQHGLRPLQSVSTQTQYIIHRDNGVVHCRVKVIKQAEGKTDWRVKRISGEYAPILSELHSRRRRTGNKRLFLCTPNSAAGRIQKLSAEITDTRWSAMDYRHTAAQRLADSGASIAAVADLLTQTTTRTAQIYFASSPSQAERINAALAISPIYQLVAKAFSGAPISAEELQRLPPDQQIGGVSHDVFITGIGACTQSQGTCTKIPAVSCYTCRSFMPLDEEGAHMQVREDLREVVSRFLRSSQDETVSPAYTQLQDTLEAIEKIIEYLSKRTKN